MPRITPPAPTGAQIAADPALTSTFAPIGDANYRFLPASAFTVLAGSALTSAAGRWRAFTFAAGADQSVGVELLLPAAWSAVDITYYWVNAGAGSGTVRWQSVVDTAGASETINATGTVTTTPVVAGAEDILTVSLIVADHPVSPNELTNLRVSRNGTGADTLGNGVEFIGARIDRAA